MRYILVRGGNYASSWSENTMLYIMLRIWFIYWFLLHINIYHFMY